MATNEIIPVDIDSRLELADRETVDGAFVALPKTIESLVDRFLKSHERREELIRAGIAHRSTLLLHGPPGCGKTVLARSIAGRLNLPLLTVRCESMCNSYMGNTPKNVRAIFNLAAREKCVLFLDEFDWIGNSRTTVSDRTSDEWNRVVISLLQNLDGFSGESILVAATNRADSIDRAIWRRFHLRIEFKPPTIAERRAMLVQFLGGRANGLGEYIAKTTRGRTGADIRWLCDEMIRDEILEGLKPSKARTAALLRQRTPDET